ncbi:MAG TPA: DUF309 domain-containing protein [Streptosporangiaceae bacterium]|nr:DUF309 domain-containing protein [Streptosporangiaceae bacterium]
MSPDRDRDRDPVGRPRNARPRDALGRPLDRAGAGAGTAAGVGDGTAAGAGVGAGAGAGTGVGEDRIPDDLLLAGPDAARLADELLRAGRPFHAHEVLEASWKTGPADERDLWQGLAQIAVGLTHAQRRNARGAVALLSRGVQRVSAYQAAASAASPAASPIGDRPYGIDLAAFLAASDDLAARIDRDGLAGIPAADLRPGLTVSER